MCSSSLDERLRLLEPGRREGQRERRSPGRSAAARDERGVRRGVRPQVGDRAGAVAAHEPEATARLEEHRAAPGRREVRVDRERLQDVAEVVERGALQQRVHDEPEADRGVERGTCPQAELDARPHRRLSRLQCALARVQPAAEAHEDERPGDRRALAGVGGEGVDDRSRARRPRRRARAPRRARSPRSPRCGRPGASRRSARAPAPPGRRRGARRARPAPWPGGRRAPWRPRSCRTRARRGAPGLGRSRRRAAGPARASSRAASRCRARGPGRVAERRQRARRGRHAVAPATRGEEDLGEVAGDAGGEVRVLRVRERLPEVGEGGGVAGQHLRPAELVQQDGARRLGRALLERAPQPVHGALRRGARHGVRRRAGERRGDVRRSARAASRRDGPRRPPARARPPPARAAAAVCAVSRSTTESPSYSEWRTSGWTNENGSARSRISIRVMRCATTAARRLVEAGDRRGVGEGAAVEDGHGARERDRLRARARRRDAGRGPRRRDRGATHRVERVAPGGIADHGPQQLAEEERVARARARTRGTQRVVGLGQRRARTIAATDSSLQRAQPQPDGLRLCDERVEQLGRRAGLVGPQGDDERDREVPDAPREIREGAHGRRVDPVQVVDREQQGRALGEVARRASRSPWSTAKPASGPASVASSPASGCTAQEAAAAAPARSDARSAPAASRTGVSKSRRTTPKANSRSISLPRAVSTRAPERAAERDAAASSALLPPPAAPSTTTRLPAPARAAATAAMSCECSASRSSRAVVI